MIKYSDDDKSKIDTSEMISIEYLNSSGLEYVDELIELSNQAIAFVESKPWCNKVINGWLSRGRGYMFGLFYFQIKPSRPDIPGYHWVIVGDLPPAYLDVEFCPTASSAIEGYVCELQEWVDRVMTDRPLDESVIPVNVPPEKKWAEQLQSRLDLIRKNILI